MASIAIGPDRDRSRGAVDTGAGERTRKAQRRLLRRRLTNWSVWGLCAAAVLGVVAPVASILVGVISKGVGHWRWSILTSTTVGQGGGLANAIVGTLLIVGVVLVLAGGVGIAGGLYIAEIASERQATILRGASEVLSGVPSIVLGFIGYTVLVVELHWGFSLGAAVLTLSVLVVPYIVKTTEVAIRSVPTAYREGGEALGLTGRFVMLRLVLVPALPGIVTGLIVGVAIALGETAPLLYTAGWNDHYPSLALTHSPVGYLPYVVYVFYNEPYASSHQLSNLAALLLIAFVVLLILVSRALVWMTQRHSPDRSTRLAKRGE